MVSKYINLKYLSTLTQVVCFQVHPFWSYITPHLPRQAPQARRFVGQTGTGLRGLCSNQYDLRSPLEVDLFSHFTMILFLHIQHQELAGTGLLPRVWTTNQILQPFWQYLKPISSPLNPYILHGSPPPLPCTHYTQGHLVCAQPAKPLRYLKVISYKFCPENERHPTRITKILSSKRIWYLSSLHAQGVNLDSGQAQGYAA